MCSIRIWPGPCGEPRGGGAAIRALRESRDWSLADLASATGVSIMGLSYLERGARNPHKGTVQKVENGLGLPPGTYSRLVLSDDPDVELAQLLAAPDPNAVRTRSAAAPVPVQRHQDTDVLEAHAEAHLESLNSLITRLPTETSNEYESYIASVIAQCVKAELLAANSWRGCPRQRGVSTKTDGAPQGPREPSGRAAGASAGQHERQVRPGLPRVRPSGSGRGRNARNEHR